MRIQATRLLGGTSGSLRARKPSRWGILWASGGGGALAVFLSVACAGGQAEPAQAPRSASSLPQEPPPATQDAASTTAPTSEGPLPIPSRCHRSTDPCTADPTWVRKLCADLYPDVALYLFRKDSPFTHGYITRKTKAVNASGGVTSGDEWLSFDEEVVILLHRTPSGGIQVSGSEGGYDALRADGSCVTLDSTEVTLNRPPKAKYASVQWRYLGDDIQEALKGNGPIFDAYVARKRECKGAYTGDVSKKCVDLDAKLNSLILDGLKAGTIALPEPQKRP